MIDARLWMDGHCDQDAPDCPKRPGMLLEQVPIGAPLDDGSILAADYSHVMYGRLWLTYPNAVLARYYGWRPIAWEWPDMARRAQEASVYSITALYLMERKEPGA